MAQPKKDIANAGRIFKNPILEGLTRTHISVPLSLFWSIGIITIWYSIARLGLGWGQAFLLFFVGAFFFSLIEYLVHRYFYHMPATNETRKRLQYVIHGIHHDHPRDKSRLALPPLLSLSLAILFILLFRALMGDAGFAFGGGFLFGYSTYLLVHYVIHVYKPPHNFLSILWKHHNVHHFVGDDGAFGVSSPFWDYVFGTMPPDPKRKAAAKQNMI
ncbi:MAG: sterol desaturase family protein [Flavobacteriales bacterium]|nr:sterol desaturase family protein [Flavobacteriales bacterium]